MRQLLAELFKPEHSGINSSPKPLMLVIDAYRIDWSHPTGISESNDI
jgi:hypothetical protein